MTEYLPTDGLIYTFYSYKGGVGRSMALASVGVSMAMDGRKVLMVDWDLEAPGLETYFAEPNRLDAPVCDKLGVVDLLEAQQRGEEISWKECILKASFLDHSIDLISAGRRSEDYQRRVQHLDWVSLYRDRQIGSYINQLRMDWVKEYDFVLIDSRTGVTDVSDICTVLLPDVLVLFFVSNHQSVNGVREVFDRAKRAHSALPVNRSALLGIPIPSRDERGQEYEMSKRWHQIYERTFDKIYREWLPVEVASRDVLNRLYVPYVASWSFGEKIPVLEDERERIDLTSLGAAYTRLATLLSHRLDWYSIAAHVTEAEMAGAQIELSATREALRAARSETSKAKAIWRRTLLLSLFALVVVGILFQYRSPLNVVKVHGKDGNIELPLKLARLREIGAQDHPGPTLVGEAGAFLKDSNPDIRSAAVRVIANMGGRGWAHAEAVATLTRDPSAEVRAAAAEALGRMAPSGQSFGRDVALLLNDSVPLVRASAVRALGQMGAAGVALAAEVSARLVDSDSNVRRNAADALGEMGREAASYFPQVAVLRNDRDNDVRVAAALAMGKMGEVPQLVAFLGDADSAVRARAAEALSRRGAEAHSASKEIAPLLADPVSSVRISAAMALTRMGEAGARFASQVSLLVRDSDWRVRLKGVEALGQMGAAGARYASAVVDALEDENVLVRNKADEVLSGMNQRR